jgi:hypothetical protein
MTVHDLVQFMKYDLPVKIPTNCNYADLASYGYSRFGYRFRKVGEDSMVRICGECKR